jgi:N-methylhydantoinase B
MSDVDPVTLEVLRNALAAVAEEMNATLVRTAYSPNIKDRRDCSCAVFDAGGDLVAQAENIPVHLGAMPYSVAAALERFPPETLDPGDAVLLNDPFHGGAHLPDLTLVTPVFVGGDLVALVANRAHHADVGGGRAGSVAADSTEIFQEGLRIPPVKYVRAGETDADLRAMLLTNVRTPEERRGDLRAQRAANETGTERVRALVERYDAETLVAAMDAVGDYAESRMRSEIADLPDGEYAFEDRLDGDGRGGDPVPIAATVTVDGDDVHVDFAGTAEQVSGPVNAPFAVTASATYYAVRSVTDPDVPACSGAYRPVSIDAPAGTVVNATPPAAVVGGNLEVSQRVVDVLFGALAACAPERAVAAGQGTMNSVTFGGHAGESFAFYETVGGGSGAHVDGDGMDGVHVHMSNTLNTPAEVLETAYPLSVRRYEYRPDSGGAGRQRGGLGVRRDIEVLADDTRFSLLADRRDEGPYGLAGGDAGAAGADYVARGGGAWERIASKSTHDLDAGDVVRVETPGGGGYGDPAERAAAAIRRDLRLGKLTADAARERYDYDAETAVGRTDDD